MRISHSRVELYSLCPAKYRFQYVDRLQVDKTFTPLLFGSSMDSALNYLLMRTKRKHVVYLETAYSIFVKHMRDWYGQNELVFFKNEMPFDSATEKDVWAHLCEIGKRLILTYKEEILPLFKEIHSIQTKKIIPNEVGDELVLITDFTATLHDGRRVIFDNKTTTDIKKRYPSTSVNKSQQLAIYAEFEPTRLAGYIALQKKLSDDRVVWKMIVDEITSAQIETAFDKIDTTLRQIKNNQFPPNNKACFSFGRKCEWASICSR